MPQLTPLPVDDVLPELLAAIKSQGAAVLQAPTGAGKTTRVPPALLALPAAGQGKILVLQPRRVAARATAARMAAEHHWQLGAEVGYQVRFDKRSSAATRIEVVTEGILLQRLHRDPFLQDTAVVVLDEFHERNLLSDLALGMIRQIQQSVRPELRVIVMSATLDPAPIAAYLDGCPIVRCSGRLYPVEREYAVPPPRQSLAASVAEAVRQVLPRTSGDLLAFLPGLSEIRQARRLLHETAHREGFELLELFGDLPADQQDAVLGPCSRRKVILATNVAETSLTIEGITAVIDSGWARIPRFDPRVGLDRLQRTPISQASAEQRAGRAGRTQPGLCLRLWHPQAQASRPERDEPEIRRVDLAGAVLQVLSWIEPDLDRFPWFEPPRPESVERALWLLRRLDAVQDRTLTRQGQWMARLPVHPRLARLLLEGHHRGCLERAALAAALLSERSPFSLASRRPGSPADADRHSAGDLLDQILILEDFGRRGRTGSAGDGLNPDAARTVLRVADQLSKECRGRLSPRAASDQNPRSPVDPDESLARALLAAFPDRLARRREPGSRRGVLVGGRGVRLADHSPVLQSPLFLCLDVDDASPDALVRSAVAVESDWLPARHVVSQVELFFDAPAERVAARRRRYWDDLLLEESPAALRDPAATARLLAESAAQHFERVFPSDDPAVSGFVARVRCLGRWLPELQLPALDDGQLRSVLPALCAGRRSFAELRQAPWLDALRGLLDYRQLQALDREAPARLQVPSGRSLPLVYDEGKPPVLAARIQELFGWSQTPRLARGRVPVLLHLLAPNMRPQQITDDLASFWQNTYPLVRKELRGRYPKHAWPEDPLTASARK